jgi:hypothetical protein
MVSFAHQTVVMLPVPCDFRLRCRVKGGQEKRAPRLTGIHSTVKNNESVDKKGDVVDDSLAVASMNPDLIQVGMIYIQEGQI